MNGHTIITLLVKFINKEGEIEESCSKDVSGYNIVATSRGGTLEFYSVEGDDVFIDLDKYRPIDRFIDLDCTYIMKCFDRKHNCSLTFIERVPDLDKELEDLSCNGDCWSCNNHRRHASDDDFEFCDIHGSMYKREIDRLKLLHKCRTDNRECRAWLYINRRCSNNE